MFVRMRSSVAVREASDDAEDENMSDEDCGAGGGGGSGAVASSGCGAVTSTPGDAGSGAASSVADVVVKVSKPSCKRGQHLESSERQVQYVPTHGAHTHVRTYVYVWHR